MHHSHPLVFAAASVLEAIAGNAAASASIQITRVYLEFFASLAMTYDLNLNAVRLATALRSSPHVAKSLCIPSVPKPRSKCLQAGGFRDAERCNESRDASRRMTLEIMNWLVLRS